MRMKKANEEAEKEAKRRLHKQLLVEVMGDFVESSGKLLVKRTSDGVEYVEWKQEDVARWAVRYYNDDGTLRWTTQLWRASNPHMHLDNDLLCCVAAGNDHRGLSFCILSGAVCESQTCFVRYTVLDHRGLSLSRCERIAHLEGTNEEGRTLLEAMLAREVQRLQAQIEPGTSGDIISRPTARKLRDVPQRSGDGDYYIGDRFVTLSGDRLSWDDMSVRVRVPDPVWTVHGKLLSYIAPDGSWAAVGLNTLYPTTPIPYQLNHNDERIPVLGAVSVCPGEVRYYDVAGGRY